MRFLQLRARPFLSLALALAVPSLVIAACGGGSSTDDSTTTPSAGGTGATPGAGGSAAGPSAGSGGVAQAGSGGVATGGHAGNGASTGFPSAGGQAGAGGTSAGGTSAGGTSAGGHAGSSSSLGGSGGDASGGSSNAGGDASGGSSSAGSGGTSSAGKAGMSGAGGSGPTLPTPIRHIVVMVKENHTFDNYFTGFPGATSSMTAKLSNGKPFDRVAAPFCDLHVDMPHSHGAGLNAYNGGKMDGFDTNVPAPDSHQTFRFYPEKQIPSYWAYAKNYVLADHFFSTMLGPSSPGHFATAMSFAPHYGNADDNCDPKKDPSCDEGKGCNSPSTATVPTFNDKTCSTSTKFPCFDVPTLFDELPKGFTYRAYAAGSGSDISSPYAMVKSIGGHPAVASKHFRSTGKLLADLASGDQPNLVWADINGGEESEHPPRHPCPGENFTVDIVNALMNGDNWMDTVFILTWDDWGGWYDNVKPAHDACGYHTGFRLPLLIISPYAKKGFILKTPAEQASIPRLIEDLWGMPRLAKKDDRARDDTAGSLMDALDFTSPPRTDKLLRTKRTDCPKADDLSCNP